MKKNRGFLLITLFVLLFVISCGNETNEVAHDDNAVTDSDQKTTDDADQTETKDWSCISDPCENHKSCSCNSDVIACVPAEMKNAPLDWAAYNAERCTVINCDKNNTESCPEGYVCYDLPMYNELMKDATTLCIDVRIHETDDGDGS